MGSGADLGATTAYGAAGGFEGIRGTSKTDLS